MTDPAYAWMVLEERDDVRQRIKTMAVGTEAECLAAHNAYAMTGDEVLSYVSVYADRFVVPEI